MRITIKPELREKVREAAEELYDRPASELVNKWVERGLVSENRETFTPYGLYACVAEIPTLEVQQHVINRAALALASTGEKGKIEALALIRGAYGASLSEAQDIFAAMNEK